MPLRTVRSTDSWALAGLATPTNPPTPKAATTAKTSILRGFRGVWAWFSTGSPHGVIGFRLCVQYITGGLHDDGVRAFGLSRVTL